MSTIAEKLLELKPGELLTIKVDPHQQLLRFILEKDRGDGSKKEAKSWVALDALMPTVPAPKYSPEECVVMSLDGVRKRIDE